MYLAKSPCKKLGGAKKTSSATPGEADASATPGETTSSGPLPLVISPALTADLVNVESSREELAQESSGQGIAEPSATGGNKKKRFAPSSSASVEARAGSEPDEPPTKRKKKEKKKKKKRTVGERSEPNKEVGGRELVAFDSSNRDVAARTSAELDESPNVPLERKKQSSCEGSVPASIEKSPPVAPSVVRSILQTPTSSQGDHAIEGSNNLAERDLEELSVRERGDVVGAERIGDASGHMIARVVPDPAPVASNLVVNEELSTPTLGVSDATLALLPGEGGAGSNLGDLIELSDSSAEEDGGEKSDEQVPESNPQGTEGTFGGSSSKEQGNVDEVENPSDPIIDGTGSASDQFGAQVVREDFDRAED
ncbi:hypothetical protein Bca4012_092409 [Brassica carinata]